MRLAGSRLGRPDVILSGIAKSSIHNGGRIAFGPDGHLYVATGDAGESGAAQDRSSLSGKILRVTSEGRPAPGNPFPDSPVWSYGHRNVQGIAWDSRGRMWASEFGQNEWDELNLIEKGGNYGWPQVEGPERGDGLTEPHVWWTPEESSPSGIAVVGDRVFVAGLRGARLWQVPVDGERAGKAQDFFTGEYGRLRSVTAAPDGSLWLGTSNRDGRGEARDDDDKILRVTFG
jgi:glucose/arabinose dehydrogenase